MLSNTDYAHMDTPLPEDIAALIAAGEPGEAEQAIEAWLKRDIPQALRARLSLEQVHLAQYRSIYTLDADGLLNALRAHVPDFTMDDLAALRREGWLDCRAMNGQLRYMKDTVDSLLRANPAFAARAGRPLIPQNPVLDRVIASIKNAGAYSADLSIRLTLTIHPDIFVPGRYLVHLPCPKPSMSQHSIRLIAASPENGIMAPESAPQRTLYFDTVLEENHPFAAEYAYTQTVRYADLWTPIKPRVLYSSAPAPTQEDLAPCPPHIVFTPYLVSLAKEITKDDAAPLDKARSVYQWITSHVRYAYQRPYRMIANGAEYTATGLKGDCGLQALLFITLLRILGIPARWESGLYAGPDHVGCHDWAQFYTEEYGWLPADCSYGGSGFRTGNAERRAFYFGNLDPYRFVANSRYFGQFENAKQYLRHDPYDNQSGEAETETRALLRSEYDTLYTLTGLTERTET